jgi:hypothetical protein
MSIGVIVFTTHYSTVYMHNPRGGNDRACETNQNRNNGNRLFDSQNNDNGGYSCPMAFPFACYEIEGKSHIVESYTPLRMVSLPLEPDIASLWV